LDALFHHFGAMTLLYGGIFTYLVGGHIDLVYSSTAMLQ
jgi:hypothetical protein